MQNPVVLCGLRKIGDRVLDFLRAAGLPVVVVNYQFDQNDKRLDGVTTVAGDFRTAAVLEQAGVRTARAVVIVSSNDLVNTSAALAVRRLNPDVRIVVRMFNPNLLARLGRAVGNVQALSVSALTAPLLAQTALTGEVLGAFSVADERYQIAKLVIAAESPLTGRRVGEIAREHRILTLAREADGRPAELLHQVSGDAEVRAGDDLTVCGPPDRVSRLLSLGHATDWQDFLPGVRWAGRLRRFGRVAWRFMAEVDLALKVCACVLFTVIVMSTAIYSLSGMSSSWPDGLYRTINVLASRADMAADRYVGWQKVFVSTLRIFGLILVAAITAIVTNFLLRARLGGALEVRRIPDGGHVVVCGLGNVGYRVVEELLKCDERVVVIERSRDNPFIGTCRRLGAAVIVSDAVVPEALRQARAATARAVVATTANDLANLEIALLARDLNAKQRVVVRLADEALAQTLREVVDVRLALSLPSLAAPAFVAALYGDRVQSLFRINRRMFAAVELTVHPDDPCLKNQTLQALAVDYGLLPVGPTDQNRRLSEGDRPTVIAVLTDLDRLFRRQPAAAEWAVELDAVLPVTRDVVAGLVRVENGLGAEEVMAALGKLPLRVGGPKTRGQAEVLCAALERERATVNLIRIE